MPEAGYQTNYVVTAKLVKSPDFDRTIESIKEQLASLQSAVTSLGVEPRVNIDKQNLKEVVNKTATSLQEGLKRRGIDIDITSLKRSLSSRLSSELSKANQVVGKAISKGASEATEAGVEGTVTKIKRSLSELATASKSSFGEATAPVREFRSEIEKAVNAVAKLQQRLGRVATAWEVVRIAQDPTKQDRESITKALQRAESEKYQQQLLKAAEASRAALLRQKVGTAMRMQALVEPTAPFVVEDWQVWYTYENQLRAAREQIAQMIAYQKATGQTAYSVIPIYDQLGNKVGQFAVMVDRAGKVITNFERSIGELFEYMFYRMSVWAIATASVYMFINAVRNAIRYVIETSRNLAFLQVAAEGIDFSNLTSGLRDIVSVYGGDMKEVIDIAYEFTKVLQDQAAALEATRLALIAYNISGLEYRESATLLVGVMKQFGIGAENIEELTDMMDAWALASKRGTVDYKELAQAFNQTAAAARSVGMNYYQLTALIETVGTATGETGNVIGTFMKYIIEHSRDLETLLALQRVGVKVVYDTGQYRDMYSVLMDLASKWKQLSETQQQYVSSVWAGVRQGPRFKALMDSLADTLARNNGEFKLLNELMTSRGEAEYQNFLMMQTLEGQWRKLQSTYSSFVASLGDTAPFLALRDILEVLNWLLGSISKSGADVFMAALAAAITMFYRRAKMSIGPFKREIMEMVKSFNEASKNIPASLGRIAGSMQTLRNEVAVATESIIANINAMTGAYERFATAEAQARGLTLVPPVVSATSSTTTAPVSASTVSPSSSLLYGRRLGAIEAVFLSAWQRAGETWRQRTQWVDLFKTEEGRQWLNYLQLAGVVPKGNIVTTYFKAIGGTAKSVFQEISAGLRGVMAGFVRWANIMELVRRGLSSLWTLARTMFVEFLPWFLLWEGVFFAYEKISKAVQNWRRELAEARRNTQALREDTLRTEEDWRKVLTEYGQLLQRYPKYENWNKLQNRIEEIKQEIADLEESPDVLGYNKKHLEGLKKELEDLLRLKGYIEQINFEGLSGKEIRSILLGRVGVTEFGTPVDYSLMSLEERVKLVLDKIKEVRGEDFVSEEQVQEAKKRFGEIQAFTSRELSAMTEQINKTISAVSRRVRDFETSISILQKSYYGLGYSTSYYNEILLAHMEYLDVYARSLNDLQEAARMASSAYNQALSRLSSWKEAQLRDLIEKGFSEQEARRALELVEEISLSSMGDVQEIDQIAQGYGDIYDKIRDTRINLQDMAEQYKIFKDQVSATQDNWEKVDQALSSELNKFAEINQQMFELIMSTEKYAGAWQSIKNTIELVKSTAVELYEAQFKLRAIATTSAVGQRIFGPMWSRADWVLQQLANEIQNAFSKYYQLEQARQAYGSNLQKLQEALAEMRPFEEKLSSALKSNVTDPLVRVSQDVITALSENTNALKELTATMGGQVGVEANELKEIRQEQVQGLVSYIIDNWAVGTEYATKLALKYIDNWAVGSGLTSSVQSTRISISGGMKGFIEKMYPYALFVSRQTGLDPILVLSQWGLETGWGTSRAFTQGLNVAGIKATASWRGGKVGSYRAYPSLEAAVADYIKVITGPLYKNVLAQRDAYAQAKALDASPWAEDPAYGKKLVSIMRNVAKIVGGTKSLPVQLSESARKVLEELEKAGTDIVKQERELITNIRNLQREALAWIRLRPKEVERIIKLLPRMEEVFGGLIDIKVSDYIRQAAEDTKNKIFELGLSIEDVREPISKLVTLFNEIRIKELNKELEEELKVRDILATVIPSQARKSSEIFQQHIQKLIDLLNQVPKEQVPYVLQEIVKYNEKYLRARLVEMYRDLFERRNTMLYLRRVAPSFAPSWDQFVSSLVDNLTRYIEEYPEKQEELAPHFRMLEEFSAALKYDVANQVYELSRAIDNFRTATTDREYWKALGQIVESFDRLYTLEEKVEDLARIWSQMPFEVPGIYDKLLEQRTLLATRELNVLYKQIEQVGRAISDTIPLSTAYFAALGDLVSLYQKENELLEQRVKLTEELFRQTGKGLEEFLTISAKRDAYNLSLLNNLRAQVFNRAITGVDETDQNKYYALLKELVSLEREWRNILQERIDLLAESFKVGVISLEDYVAKLRELRDTTYEIRSSAFSFYTGIGESLESAFSKGLAGALTGSLTAKEDFIGAVKESMAGIFSDLFTKVLFNTTGIRQLIEEATLGIAQAVLTGGTIDVDTVRNNFNKILATLTSYFPVFKQTLQGIFETLKDRVYNAPSGFRIERYLYEYLKARGPEDIPGLAWPVETNLPSMPAMPSAGVLEEREVTSILTNPLREAVDNIFVTLDGFVKRLDETMTSFFGRLGQGFENLFNQLLAKFGVQQQLAQAPEIYTTDFTKVLSKSVLSQIGELRNDRWILPARVLGAILGEQVDWDNVTRQVIIGGKRFTPIENRKGVAWVSLREVAEALGYNVRWSEKTHDVIVSKSIVLERSLNQQSNLLSISNNLLTSQNSIASLQSQLLGNISSVNSQQYLVLQDVNGNIIQIPIALASLGDRVVSGITQALSSLGLNVLGVVSTDSGVGGVGGGSGTIQNNGSNGGSGSNGGGSSGGGGIVWYDPIPFGPIRQILEARGWTVTWNNTTKTITATHPLKGVLYWGPGDYQLIEGRAWGYIPRHGEGGIAFTPHIGLVAEKGPEAIIPLEKLPTIFERMASIGTEINITLNVNVDARGSNWTEQDIIGFVRKGVTEGISELKRSVRVNNLRFKGVAY